MIAGHPTGCSHRFITRIIDVQRPVNLNQLGSRGTEGYQFLCRECLAISQPAPDGMTGWIQWLHENLAPARKASHGS